MKGEKRYSRRPVCLLAPAALIAALGLGTASHAFAAAVMDVQGGPEGALQSIADGSITPSVADGTDFGRATAAVEQTYTIFNTGDADLNLNGDPLVNLIPVADGDTGCSAFTVTTDPDATTLVPAPATDPDVSSTTFKVTYTQAVPGSVDECTISIANDIDTENPYDFVVQGSTNPVMGVTGGADDNPIVDGAATTSADNGTLFAAGSPLEKTYIINNYSDDLELALTGTPIVALSDEEGCAAFSVTTQPTSTTIAAGDGINPETATFKVTYTPPTPETGAPCTVSIDNDIDAENPYDFVIQAELPEMDVQGGTDSVSIVDGDDTPSAADDTDFGGLPTGTDVGSKTYTIRNIGGKVLNLDGDPFVNKVPVATGDAGCGAFTVTQPTVTTLATGEKTTFIVTYSQNDPNITDKCKISIANDDSDENPYDFVIQASTGPEMDVMGGAGADQPIADGATTTSTDNDTRFTAGSTAEKTYTIENTGGAALNLTAEDPDPLVALSGEGCGGFEVTAQPAKTTIAVTENTTFKVKYTPPTDDAKKTGAPCKVSIANDDGNENPYDFVIQAALPEIDVQGNSVSIADGDSTPSADDDTSFGEVAVGESMVKTYTILNIGGADLTLGATTGTDPIVALTGDGCDDDQFTVTQPEAKTLVPAPATESAVSSTTFKVTYTPTSTKKKQCTVNITNDDSDENPYEFAIQGGQSGASYLPAVYEVLLNGN